jgi:hypothetical protein
MVLGFKDIESRAKDLREKKNQEEQKINEQEDLPEENGSSE